MNILIGADPELFVFDGADPVSGHGLIPGTKANPFPVARGAVQVDGMALEFNIDPADSEDSFVMNLQQVMEQMQSMVPNYKLVAKPSVEFPDALMKAQPPEAKELGCDPDFNAYTGEANPRPNGETNMRTGGGHIHIGWTSGADPFDPVHYNDCREVVKALDCTLAIAAMQFDKDSKRRTMYGNLGAFRPKPYGVEYRVLSNAWTESEVYMRYVYRITIQTINRLLCGEGNIFNNRKETAQFIYRNSNTNMGAVRNYLMKLNVELLNV